MTIFTVAHLPRIISIRVGQHLRKYLSASFQVAPGEGVEPSISSSKPDVLPVTPSRKTWSPLRVTCSLTLTHPHRIDRWSRRQELNLRFSIISRASCRWTTPRLVDPTRLKRAPHGLKGRRSISRAPDQKMAVAEGLEPSHVGLTIRCLTNLATPQNDWKSVFRNTDFTNGGYGWTRTTNLALMRRLLFPVELHSHELWKPAEELNLVPVRPALKVRFRRPMPGTRASSAALRLISACSAVKGFFHAEARR